MVFEVEVFIFRWSAFQVCHEELAVHGLQGWNGSGQQKGSGRERGTDTVPVPRRSSQQVCSASTVKKKRLQRWRS